MVKRLANPFPTFFDLDGSPLHGGTVHIGEAGKDPELFPIAVFYDDALSIPAAQPLHALGGVLVNGASPVHIYMASDDYSIRVRNAAGAEVLFLARTFVAGVQYQPLDEDLSAIAALSSTPFGRNLLTLANAAALKAATGMPDALPLVGGAVTGNIVRSGAGTHLFWNDPAMQAGNVFVTAADGADPTSAAGHIWLKEKP